jgi:uncharacterized protein
MGLLIGIVAPYLSLCGLFYALQARLVYVPTRELLATPRSLDVDYQDLTLTTTDGVRLHAWLVRGAPGAPWVLQCHGNGGNISHHLQSLRPWVRMGCSVLLFDYRGYGSSEGAPSEEGLYRDAEAAWNYLVGTLHVAADEIVIHGTSLGGGVASWLAAQHTPRALVLQSTFTSVPDMGSHLYPWLPVGLLCRHRFASMERVAGIACPVLHMHDPHDELIPYAMGQRLYQVSASAQYPRQWLDIVGGHNGGLEAQPPEVLRRLEGFIKAGGRATRPARPAAGMGTSACAT